MAALSDALWFREHDASGCSGAELRGLIQRGVGEASALLLTNIALPPDPFPLLDELGGVLGRRCAFLPSGEGTVGEQQWVDVRFDPEGPYTFQYSNTMQPLHNDGAYLDPIPDLTLFYLEKQADGGGESLFVDVDTVARYLSERDPGLYRDLTRVPVWFNTPQSPGRTCKVIDRVNGRLEIAWNYYRVAPGQDPHVYELRERFRAFLETLVADNRAFTFRLNAGDVLIFDDRTLLHGRRAFSATRSGDRLLWKTYFLRAGS